MCHVYFFSKEAGVDHGRRYRGFSYRILIYKRRRRDKRVIGTSSQKKLEIIMGDCYQGFNYRKNSALSYFAEIEKEGEKCVMFTLSKKKLEFIMGTL